MVAPPPYGYAGPGMSDGASPTVLHQTAPHTCALIRGGNSIAIGFCAPTSAAGIMHGSRASGAWPAGKQLKPPRVSRACHVR